MIEETKAPARKPRSEALRVIYKRRQGSLCTGGSLGEAGRPSGWGTGIPCICLVLATSAPAQSRTTSSLLPPAPAKAAMSHHCPSLLISSHPLIQFSVYSFIYVFIYSFIHSNMYRGLLCARHEVVLTFLERRHESAIVCWNKLIRAHS